MRVEIEISSNIFFLPEENLLILREGKKIRTVKLEPLLSEMLEVFVNHKNQMISKEHFIEAIWYNNVFVGQAALRKNIYKLRNLFSANGMDKQLEIITVPKKGYKLMVHQAKTPIKHVVRLKSVAYGTAALLLILLMLNFMVSEEEDVRVTATSIIAEESLK
ncbi:hypothetical protein GWK08_10955 [Leptobacterium flavescens]|uniref:OmpR/PhoB-type domain-containing protein n=1 Tax=Leptobacterium flavescens TaxID=472055 RepID=A0A6P0UKR2_9FLAO|nr:winged helix-turn-helix domain-containing protein [Leptobacterium flavescens]NER13961.1 hypothetical protein [Leptobacterium flavescens]